MKSRLLFLLCCFLTALSMTLGVQAQTTRYVSITGTSVDASTATSWANAHNDLQAVIDSSQEGDIIWVAAGTYKPTQKFVDSAFKTNGDFAQLAATDRFKFFLIKAGVKIYGGFAGTETSLAERSLGNAANASILSGDVNSSGGTYDGNDAYHVLVFAGDSGKPARLDGFTVTGGNANGTTSTAATSTITRVNGLTIYNGGSSSINGGGGAIYCVEASPALVNLTIQNNYGSYGGGAVFNMNANPTFINCLITGNKTMGGKGNGMCNQNSSPTLINVTIAGNNSTAAGTGILNTAYDSKPVSAPKIYNSIIFGNGTTAVSIENPDSCVFITSYVPGLPARTGLLFPTLTDPMFANFAGGDFHLTALSPLVNAGTAQGIYTDPNTSRHKWLPDVDTIDLEGNIRLNFDDKNIVDLGAYEFQGTQIKYNPGMGIFYVTQTGSGNKTGNSWTQAADSAGLANMLYLAAGYPALKEIWVAKGTYTPAYKAGNGTTDRDRAFVMLKDVKIYGGFAGTETALANRILSPENVSVLSGDFLGNDDNGGDNSENAYHVVVASDSVGSAVLDGFTITGGNANATGTVTINGENFRQRDGGGIYLRKNASPVLSNLIVTKNRAAGTTATYGGGGIAMFGSSPVISNVTVSENTTLATPTTGCSGAGMFISNYSNPVLNNVAIINNKGFTLGGGAYIAASGTNISLTNVLVAGNDVASTDLTNGNGGGLYVNSGDVTFTNVTITGNTASGNASGAGGLNVANAGAASALNVRNSIIHGNTPNNFHETNTVAERINFAYSLVEGSTTWDETKFGADSGNNIDAAPLFVDASTGNYMLQATSPAINKGSNAFYDEAANAGSTDLSGGKRISGGTIDMGAYEGPFIFTPSTGGIVYVTPEGAGTQKGDSWANAAGGLADVLKQAYTDNTITQIWVAGGTYKPAYRIGEDPSARYNTFLMRKDLKIYGSFAGTEAALADRNLSSGITSVLSGDLNDNDPEIIPATNGSAQMIDNAYHVVTFLGDAGTACLDGFVVTGGYADKNAFPQSADITVGATTYTVYFNAGGGIYSWESVSPMFSNLIIRKNGGVNGAGMYNSGDATADVLIGSNPVITNVLMHANTASSQGGAIKNSSSNPVLTNVTITGNQAAGATSTGSGHAIYNDLQSKPEIRNSIIHSNCTTAVVNTAGCVPVYTNSMVENITADGVILGGIIPFFADIATGNYQLGATSPCINAGVDSVFDAGQTPDLSGITKDLLGNPRKAGTIDLGAFEFTGTPLTIAPSAEGILYVSQTGDGNKSGSSWANAAEGLALPLYFAQAKTDIKEIWVKEGTYKPSMPAGNGTHARDITFLMVNNVKVYGSFAGTETSLEARVLPAVPTSILSGDILGNDSDSDSSTLFDNAYHVVVGANLSNAVLDGFIVESGNASPATNAALRINGQTSVNQRAGGGFALYGVANTVTFSNLIVRNNHSGKTSSAANNQGGGMYLSNSSPKITNVTIANNTAIRINGANGDGGGMYLTASHPTLTNVLVKENRAGNMGGGIYASGNPALTNVAIIDNIASNAAGNAGQGGGLYATGSGAILTNVTIAGNTAGATGAPYIGNQMFMSNSGLQVRNSIIYGNDTAVAHEIYGNMKIATFTNSLIKGSGGSAAWTATYGNDGGNNIDVDPNFVDAENGDYAINEGPAADAGDNSFMDPTITKDLAGNERIQGIQIDMGAYELLFIPTIRYVKVGGKPAADAAEATSWADACDDLQAVINASSEADVIFVQEGRYTPTIQAGNTSQTQFKNRDRAFVMKKNVKIYGSFKGTETSLAERTLADGITSILSGDFRNDDEGDLSNDNPFKVENAFHVVIFAGEIGNACLDGFEVSGGCANNNSSLEESIFTITVNGERITRAHGGGIFVVNSAPKLSNLVIKNNWAWILGGGIYNFKAKSVMSNILVYGNGVVSYGSGIYNTDSSEVVITNATISRNLSSTGAGIYNAHSSTAVVRNSIITGNGGTNALLENVANSSLILAGGRPNKMNFINCLLSAEIGDYDTVTNASSSVSGIMVAEGNMLYNEDPWFEDALNNNFRLKSFSAAIDAGDKNFADVAVDMAGNPRIHGDNIDLGVYEFQGEKITITPNTDGILFVSEAGAGDKSGNSWENATEGLADALFLAQKHTDIKEIWVKEGTYKPKYAVSSVAGSRDFTFAMVKDVKLYGSFAGTETSLDARVLPAVPTSILSGDLAGNDANGSNIDENVYNVVLSSGNIGTACLDGFVVTGGNANSSSNSDGGGIVVKNSSPVLTNLLVTKNTAGKLAGGIHLVGSASEITGITVSDNTVTGNGSGSSNGNGGGMYIDGGTPKITNVFITGNKGYFFGGGVYNKSSEAVFTNVVISGNSLSRASTDTTTGSSGGGVYNSSGNVYMTNVTITGNTALGEGSGLFNNMSVSESTLKIRNSIIAGNVVNNGVQEIAGSTAGNANVSRVTYSYSLLGGSNGSGANWLSSIGTDGGNNIDANAHFDALVLGKVTANSPAVNAGSGSFYQPITDALSLDPDLSEITTDIAGNPRTENGTVDMGAYEIKFITITGKVDDGVNGLANVRIDYNGDFAITGADGNYTARATYGSTVTLVPSQTGRVFTPEDTTLVNVTVDVANVNFSTERAKYHLTLVASPAEGGSVQGEGDFYIGNIAAINATANANYDFLGWYNDTVLLTTEASYNYYITGAVTLTARFQIKSAIEDLTLSGIDVYSKRNNIYIENNNNTRLSAIQVFDMLGHLVIQTSAGTSTVLTVNGSTGYYVVRLVSADGRIATKKVYITK